MTSKVYQGIFPNFELHMNVVTVKGYKVPVKFLGGSKYPENVCGKYSTNNKDIQEALESHHAFNKSYKLVSTVTTDSEPEKPVKQPAKATEVKTVTETKVQEDSTNTEPKDPESLVGIGITSGQKAKDFIRKHFPEVPFSKLTSNDSIKQIAKEKGITFPDWII